MTIPPITKDVWDHIQSFHPKKLALSFLRAEKKKDQLPLTFQNMMQKIHDLSSTKPLNIRIGMWYIQLSEKDKVPPISASDCKYVFIPRQKLLKVIDPTGARALADVLDEVEILVEKYQAAIAEDDESYKQLSLCELLDIYETFHLVNYRHEGWSAVDLCCGCPTC
jgi:hypothetical protein